MPAVVYAERFGSVEDAALYRQVRATGVGVVTHDYRNPKAFPYERVDVVQLRTRLVDTAISRLRALRAGHKYRLAFGAEAEVAECVLKWGATTIHACSGVAGARMCSLAPRLECGLLVSLRGPDVFTRPEEEESFDVALEELLERADRVLLPSRAARARLIERGAPADLLEVLLPGVPLPPLRPRRAENRGPVRVAVLGAIDGVLEDAAARTRADLELVEDDDYERCDVAVLHRDEGPVGEIPPAVLEAMAHGVCVVAPRGGTAAEAVQDGVTGLLVDEGDPAHLAAALAQVAGDPGLRVALGAAARAAAERDFDEPRVVERLLQLYG